MTGDRRCTVCASPLVPPPARGHASPRCSDTCRAAARRHRLDIASWERAAARWDLEAADHPRYLAAPRQAAWCRSRMETVRGLPDSFYLNPRAHWAPAAGEGDAP